MTATAANRPVRIAPVGVPVEPIPLTRIVRVELRKMFDTRSGFWLIASIAITVLLATGGASCGRPTATSPTRPSPPPIRLPDDHHPAADRDPAVTSEWSQRTGLTTFTLVPHRSRVIIAKAISSVGIAIAAMVITFAVGALGNLLGAAVRGSALVWDVSVTQCLYYVLGMVLSLLIGFMLGVLIRASTGAIVAYFILTFLLPTVFGLLATSQHWFHQLQPWVDIQFAQAGLFVFDQSLTGQEWAHIVVTGITWLLIPMLVGLRLVMRTEVK